MITNFSSSLSENEISEINACSQSVVNRIADSPLNQLEGWLDIYIDAATEAETTGRAIETEFYGHIVELLYHLIEKREG